MADNGRPTIYNEKLGIKICSRIAKGESLRSIVKDNKMPVSSTIFRWLLEEDKKKFKEQYKEARNVQAELMFEELLEIADENDDKETSNRSRLRVDTRKWYLSKVLPKKFGDKLDLTSDNEKIQPVLVTYVNEKEPENNKDTD